MHALSSYQNSANKITKIAIVTLLHAGVALALMSMRAPTHDVEVRPELFLMDPVAKVTPPIEPTPVDEPVTHVVPPLYVPPSVTVNTSTDAPHLTTSTVLPTEPTPPAARQQVIAEVAPPVVAKIIEPKTFRAAQTGNCAVPNYPANAARNGDQGTVGLALLIAPDGRVTDSKVTSTSGSRELDRAAIAALSLCHFKPASTNGVPEAAWGKIAYIWTLEQ